MKMRIILAFLFILISLQLVNARLENRYETENMLVEFNFTENEDCKQDNNWVSLTDEIRINLKREWGSTYGSCEKIYVVFTRTDMTQNIPVSGNLENSYRTNYCFEGTIEKLFNKASKYSKKDINSFEGGEIQLNVKLRKNTRPITYPENISFNFTLFNKGEVNQECEDLQDKTTTRYFEIIFSIIGFFSLLTSIISFIFAYYKRGKKGSSLLIGIFALIIAMLSWGIALVKLLFF